uniref:Uncharacterized protein n=1 Tax=Cacopsylla melanoneura TaxID=428564 RepID=A0A8D9B6K5_9HEMI
MSLVTHGWSTDSNLMSKSAQIIDVYRTDTHPNKSPHNDKKIILANTSLNSNPQHRKLVQTMMILISRITKPVNTLPNSPNTLKSPKRWTHLTANFTNRVPVLSKGTNLNGEPNP